MRKKFLLTLAAILAATVAAFCFAACGSDCGSGGEKEHTHSYVDGVCTVCGEKENDDDKGGEAEHTHSYAETVIAPTCTENGYTLHKCSCGDEYNDTETGALGHDYSTEWTIDKAATCTETGIKSHHCTRCEAKTDETEIPLADHKYNVDGVCTVCGNKTIEEATGLEYTLSDGGTYYIVTGIGKCEDADIIIPAEYNGKPVKTIGARAFYGCSSLTNIIIPDSVTSIDESAFSNCSSLTSITIPDSVTSIGYNTVYGYDAFYGCGALQFNEYDNALYLGNDTNKYVALIKAKSTDIINCNINENCKVVAAYAFYNCSSLTSITISDSVASIDNYAFDGCNSLQYNEYDNALYLGNDTNKFVALIKAKSTDITSCAINENCKTISGGAFYFCYGLEQVTIGNSVAYIGDSAFGICGSLTNVIITDSVTYVGDGAFSDCSSLTSIAIPNSVTSIGEHAFWGCSSLESITIPDSVTSIGEYVFYECGSLSSIFVAENNAHYKSIDDNLYSKDGKTLIQYAIGKTDTSFTISDSVTSIRGSAFCYCSSLTSITIGSGVTSIDCWAFSYCSSLEKINVRENNANYSSIDGILYNKNRTEIIYVPSGIKGEITFPDSVTSLGDYVFEDCRGLTSITIPDSVTSIGDGAFDGCSSLTSVTIPDSVTSMGGYAFYGCTSLDSIVIPDSVTSIGDGAFDGCSSLTSIIIPDSVTSLGNGAFSGCRSLTSITIPDSVPSIGNQAFDGCSSLTSVTIGSGVTSIGGHAFWNCSSLTSIEFKGTKAQWKAIEKDSYWKEYTGDFTVTCTDGTLTKDEG